MTDMMICPNAHTCLVVNYCSEHSMPHERHNCDGDKDCPDCIPVEQPEPERLREDYGEAQELLEWRYVKITELRALLDTAVRERANTVAHCRRLRQRLDGCYGELECVRDERDELVVKNIALMLERDRLRKDLASLERGAGAVCKMNNTKLDVIERLRGEVAELTGERDALRLRLANTDRDADQLGKMLDECQVSGLAIQRENADLRTRLDQARAMHCAGDDDPDENSIPLYKCNADDSRPVFCAVSDCRLRTPHSALEHPGCRGGLWWCPMFEDTVECEVVE